MQAGVDGFPIGLIADDLHKSLQGIACVPCKRNRTACPEACAVLVQVPALIERAPRIRRELQFLFGDAGCAILGCE